MYALKHYIIHHFLYHNSKIKILSILVFNMNKNYTSEINIIFQPPPPRNMLICHCTGVFGSLLGYLNLLQ